VHQRRLPDIGWHSPEVISERPNRLSDVLRKEIDSCIAENRLLNLYELSEKLVKDYDQEARQKHDEPLERIQGWARELYEQHRVRMFYNPVKRHSHTGGVSPAKFEEAYFLEAATV
jgi:hypothetical protein